jgi:hypothetical protein
MRHKHDVVLHAVFSAGIAGLVTDAACLRMSFSCIPAGLLTAITAASPVLAALVQPTQQRQQQQQQQNDGISCTAMLAVQVLHVWSQCVCTLFIDKAHLPASSIVAMSGLVAAALKTHPAGSSSSSSGTHSTSSTSSSSSSTFNTDSGTVTSAGSSSSSTSDTPLATGSNRSAAAAAGADALFGAHLQFQKAQYSSMQLQTSAAKAAFALVGTVEDYN